MTYNREEIVKELTKTCADKIVDVFGITTFMHRNDIYPDILEAVTSSYRQGVEEARENLLLELNIIWVCPPCAKQFFGRGYTEGKTNISTAVHRQCEACHQYNQCMHYRSYDKPKSDLLTNLEDKHD